MTQPTQKTQKTKKTPLRMCIVCREMKPKAELLRLIKLKDNEFTFNPKAFGRGAYICKNDKCVQTCVKKKVLNKAYKLSIPDEVYAKLLEEYEQFGKA